MIAHIFALGQAPQAEAHLKGACRLRQHRPDRKDAQPIGAQSILPVRRVPHEGQYLPGIAPSRAPCGDGKIAGVIVHLIYLQALMVPAGDIMLHRMAPAEAVRGEGRVISARGRALLSCRTDQISMIK
jgi:hypothetical protein